MSLKECSNCNEFKDICEFYKARKQCKDCLNYKRREKYKNDVEYRTKCIRDATELKKRKSRERKEKYILEIGLDNKKCRYCNLIKHKSEFRHNRLKCRICERDDPKEKFKRYVRTRIYNCLKRNKNRRSIEYLGCSNTQYFNYIMNYNCDYTIENYGSVWHIDHVIPISHFDMEDDYDTTLAFNWRNTMPLSCIENLSKNNRIDQEQIITHLEKLKEYHLNEEQDFPIEFKELFAKHLDAGNSLESQTTTPILETDLEDLG